VAAQYFTKSNRTVAMVVKKQPDKKMAVVPTSEVAR